MKAKYQRNKLVTLCRKSDKDYSALFTNEISTHLKISL